MAAKRSPSLHSLDDDTDLGGRWFNRGLAEENPRSDALSSSANIPSPPSRSQSFSKLPEHLSKPTVDMNNASVLDLVRDKEHDTKPSAMAVKARDSFGSMTLIQASRDGHEGMARLLTDKGADINAQSSSGSTALILASQGGHEAVARLLIDKGADVPPSNALGSHHSATMALHPRAPSSASDFKAAPF
ncbi:hypothetical protein B0I37DRAFT_376910 [Chaetomium sp. MPI-CAGE-AT-0009]|nr:hypothetical protein B0I37DRAFT_376910 [Chaetomium sp. MPI-CAGE-AT-0009]